MWAVLSLLGLNGRTRRTRVRGFRPRVESLEDRTCLSPGVMEWDDPTGNLAADVTTQPDGKIVTVGRVDPAPGTHYMEVMRFNTDGTLDTSFNGTGKVVVTSAFEGDAVAIQPDGKIVAAGRALTRSGDIEYMVARLNSNGSLDTAFGNTGGKKGVGPGGGVWLYNASTTAAEYVKGLAVMTDVSNHLTGIMLGGQLSGAFEAMKLTPAGVLDTTFGGDGDVFYNVGSVQAVGGMTVTPPGGVVMVGHGNSGGVVLALNSAGGLDTSFNGTGYRVDNFAPGGTTFDAVMVQPTANGYRLIVSGWAAPAGATQNAGLVVAYTVGGQLDPAFGSGGTLITAAAGEFRKVALETDGSIVVLGFSYITNPDGSLGTQSVVGHLFADGTLDTSFGTSGNGFTVLPHWDGGNWMGLAIDPQGFIAVDYTSGGQVFVARLTGP